MEKDNLKKDEIITNDEAQSLEGGVAEVQSIESVEPIAGDGKAAICCVGNDADLAKS